MKKNLKAFVINNSTLSLLVILISLACLSFHSNHSHDHNHSNKSDNDPFCPNKEYHDCFSDHVKNADFVFEGTVTNSIKFEDKNGNSFIENTYEVDKLFKGKLKKGCVKVITDCSKVLKEFEELYSNAGIEMPRNLRLPLSKKGDVGIILANASSVSFEQVETKSVKNKKLLSYSLFNFFPKYTYEYDYVIYYNLGGKSFNFPTHHDVYTFIFEALGKSKYKDFTNKKLKKNFKQ